MTVLFSAFIFLVGLAVGSFLNCLIYRLQKNGRELFSAVFGRSYCPHCKHTLAVKDLIPLLSFALLKARCRYCKKPISWQYPTVEIATGLLFLLIFNFQTILGTLFLLLIACFLIIIFVYDLKHYIIPDRVIYPAIVITFLYRLFGTFEFRILNLFRISNFEFRILEPFAYSLAAAIGAAMFFSSIVLVSRGRWMGVGDIKLGFLMGLFLGWPAILVAIFGAFISGAIIGIGLIVAGKKTLKSEVPFGPFLVSGMFLALFLGEKIINWYLNLFLLK